VPEACHNAGERHAYGTDILLAAEQLTVTPDALIGHWFTNSMLVTLIVTVLVVIWARRSTKKMTSFQRRPESVRGSRGTL